MGIWEIIEILENAKINIDNIKRGIPGDLAKSQIDTAIKELEILEEELADKPDIRVPNQKVTK